VPGIEVSPNQTVWWGDEVCDVVEDLRVEGLAVDIKDGETVDVYLEHVAAGHNAALLGLKACSFADVGHDPGPFFFAVFGISAVPAVY
jgi:hypothetical protein